MMRLTRGNAWLARTGAVIGASAQVRGLMHSDIGSFDSLFYGIGAAICVWTALVIFGLYSEKEI